MPFHCQVVFRAPETPRGTPPLPLEGCWGHFPLMVVPRNTAKCTPAQVFAQTRAPSLLGRTPTQQDGWIFRVSVKRMSNCFPKWFYHFTGLPATCGGCRSTSFPVLGVVGCGEFRCYDGHGVVSHCGLVCVSPWG